MYDPKYYVLFYTFYTLVTYMYVIAVVSNYMGFLEVPPVMIRNLYFSY